MQITVAEYLAKRLALLGIKDVFGLPGDFNFNVLDAIIETDGINWVNSVNELNAGYSADGYARINGFGAIVTTYGVGELSAINAIAGAYSENLPVMKIAGVPNTKMIENKVLLHHNFQKPDYYAFERAFSNVTETTAYLDENNAKSEIDRIFEVMYRTRRPVYVAIPVDICKMMIDDKVPELKLISDENNLKQAVKSIEKIVNASKKPVILADYIVERYGLKDEFESLVNKVKFPTTTLLMGKSLIDETNESFIGSNLGSLSAEGNQSIMAESDCVLTFGTLFSDLNTAGFSIMPDERFKIDIQADYVVVDGKKYNNIYMADVIRELKNVLNENAHSYVGTFGYEEKTEANSQKLMIEDVFPKIQNFLKENDIFFAETGVTSFSFGLMKLPKNCSFQSQTLWGSIGWATPAAFGAAMADKSRRVVLFTGEGAHQLTAQEVSNMMNYNTNMVVFVLNNSGYTIERILSQDPMDAFNDITQWDYSKLPEAFCGNCKTYQVRTPQELDETLKSVQIESQSKFCYVELFTDKMDVPKAADESIANIKKNMSTKVLREV